MRRFLEMRADFSIFVCMDRGEIIIYQTDDGETRLDVRMENDSVWLTQAQIAQLFGTEIPAISKHIRNIVQSGELEREATVSKMEIVRQEGARTVKRRIDTYNLDMILSVGYRVNSKNATQLRSSLMAPTEKATELLDRLRWDCTDKGTFNRLIFAIRFCQLRVYLKFFIAERHNEKRDLERPLLCG